MLDQTNPANTDDFIDSPEGSASEGSASEGSASEGSASEGSASEGSASEGSASEGSDIDVSDAAALELFEDEEGYDLQDEDDLFGDLGEADHAAKPTEEPAKADQPQNTEPTYTVRYNGKDVNLTLDELKTNAQKGLNYDHIKSERDELKTALGDGQHEGAQAEQTAPKDEEQMFLAFCKEYPDISPDAIPEGVWNRTFQGEDLLTAYRAYENQQLKTQLRMHRQNEENRGKAVGSVQTEATSDTMDSFLSGLLEW